MKPAYGTRVLLTAIAVAFVLLGNALVLPGVPAEFLDRVSGLPSILSASRMRLLSLGILPYLSAATLLLLLSGMIDRLRRMREGTAEERGSFDGGIVWIALIIGLVQALLYVKIIPGLTSPNSPGSSYPLLLLMVPSALAGMSLLIWIALVVTRVGIGNGVVWMVIATLYLATLPTLIQGELTRLSDSGVALSTLPVAGMALVGLVVLCCRYLQSQQSLVLAPVGGLTPLAPREPPTLPLRFNLVGVVPAGAARWVLASVAAMSPSAAQRLVMSPAVYWTLFAVLTILLSYVFAGIGFDTRRVGTMLERFGYRIEGAQGRPTEEYLDRIIEKRILRSAAVLIAIVVAPDVLEVLTGVRFSRAGISGETLLVGCAIVLDVNRHARGLRVIEGQASYDGGTARDPDRDASLEATEGASAPDLETVVAQNEEPLTEAWVDVFEADTELEARLALATLESGGVRGVMLCNRVIPLTGTFAYWEWTVPTYPSLVIHRRLGGGRVLVKVRESQADRAKEILAVIVSA